MKRNLSPALWLALALGIFLLGCSTREANEETLADDREVTESQDSTALERGSMQDPQDLQGVREVAELRQQKTEFMIQELLRKGRAAFADGRLIEAEDHALAALGLDNSHTEALTLLEEVQRAQGKITGSVTGSSDDLRMRLVAQMQRLQAEGESHADRGFRLLSEGEHDEAIGSLELARAAIQGSAGRIDWGDLPSRVESALVQAREERDLANAAQREDARREVYEQLQAEELAKQEARQRRMDTIMADAVEAFENEEYQHAIDLSEQLLRVDPTNERAIELKDSAFRAHHERVSDKFVEERTERFKRWLEDNREARIPTSDIFTSPDPEHWAQLTKARESYRQLGLISEDDEENLRIAEEITVSKIPGLRFDGETSLEAVVDQLRAASDIPFVVTPDAVEAVDAEGIEFTLDLPHEMTVENALKVITDAAGAEVTYTFRHGVVYITTTTKAQGELLLHAHDVQDLTAQMVDFSGPKISEIRLPDSTSIGVDEEEPTFGGPVGEPQPRMNPDNLETLIRQTIAPLTWDDVEGVSIRYSNGFLIVVHTADVQRQVQKFLNDLRRYIASVVTIEARFLTIEKDYLQEIGVDFRGLGGAVGNTVTLDDLTSGLEDNSSRGLDNDGAGLPAGAETSPSAGAFFDEFLDGDIRGRTEGIIDPLGSRLSNIGGLTMQFVFLDDTQTSLILRAVEKSNRAEELMSNTLSVQNTGRGYVTVLNQITYVQEMDVEVAQAALIADPVVGVINDGIVLDVRPTISHDRRYITLELRPTVATLLRPIPEFTSSLAGLTTPVTLQLPELQVSSANTTAIIPDGGTVVIGGLKKLLNTEARAEVPFLAKIPILSLLFKTEGEANEQQDVIILIRAHITDVREIMERLDATTTAF